MNLSSFISLLGSTWKDVYAPIKRSLQNIPALVIRNLILIYSLNLFIVFMLRFCANLVFKPKWHLSLCGVYLLGVFAGSSHVTFSFHFGRLEKTDSYILFSEELVFIPFFMLAAYFGTCPIHSSWTSGQDWGLLCVFSGSFQCYRMTRYPLRQTIFSCLNGGLHFHTDVAYY